jgi:hypothetical protein
MRGSGQDGVRRHLAPCPKVRAFRPRLAVWERDQVLGHMTKRDERFTAAHAHGLEILHLFRTTEGVTRLVQGASACHERPEGEVGRRLLLTPRNPQAQPDVEGQCEVHVGKLLLRVQVRWVGDDPLAPAVGMDIPDVVRHRMESLRVDLLHKLHGLVRSLTRHVP